MIFGNQSSLEIPVIWIDKQRMEAVVKIDAQGRIDLPESILRDLHIAVPGELTAHISSGKLELTPKDKPVQPRLILEDGILVAANTAKFDAVAAIQSLRDERL